MTTLRGKQVLFLRYLARLVLHSETLGVELRMGEGYVGDTDAADGDYDGPHKQGGQHYNRLAMDLMLDVNGVWQTKSCPEWYALGEFWKRLDPLCAWGGDWGDFNHFSLRHNGRA